MLVCRRFGGGPRASTAGMAEGRCAEVGACGGRGWCLVDEASRCAMGVGQTEEERRLLPFVRGHSWVRRYNELLRLRRPLAFDRLYGDLHARRNDCSEVVAHGVMGPHAAVCTTTMRAGVHCATFTITGKGVVGVGVLRRIKGGESVPVPEGDHVHVERVGTYYRLLRETHDINVDHSGGVKICTFNCTKGDGMWSDGRVSGSIPFNKGEAVTVTDKVGLRLNLDRGTLTVYKNERRLGALKKGLTGEYWWCVYLSRNERSWRSPSVRIARVPRMCCKK